MPDLVGIGSINLDLVVDSVAAASVDLDEPRLGLDPEDIGGERAIDAGQSMAALDYLSSFEPVISMGGSALNVCAAVAGTGAAVTVGFVGVLGRDGPSDFSLPDRFRDLGIDATNVETAAGPPGLCLAVTKGGERTLLTTGGANDRLGRLLRRRADEIAGYLGSARLVHVTSLAGLDDLDPLIDLLGRVRRAFPSVRLSCDPGAIWTAVDRPDGADEIQAHCHQLLVNRREFAAIGGVPEAIFERWPAVDLIVVKAAYRVEVHNRSGRSTTHVNPLVVDPSEIVDDTGAGDAFAAGFLVGQLDAAIGQDRGVRLGMDMARVTLGFPGMSAVERLAEVYRHVLAS